MSCDVMTAVSSPSHSHLAPLSLTPPPFHRQFLFPLLFQRQHEIVPFLLKAGLMSTKGVLTSGSEEPP